ncbi:MAG: hypothetical protein PHE79_12065 [Eubacteriales bacterium]|nr:hypothetical protein [Eubacteriales bacterium]
MAKARIADEEVRKYINEGRSNYWIFKEAGVNYARIDKLRKEYGKPLPDPEKPVEVKVGPAPVVESVQPEPKQARPFPFEPKESVIYSGQMHTVRSVGESRMVLRRNADMKGVTILLDDYNAGRASIRKVDEKKTNTYEHITRNRREDEEAEDAKAPQTVFERIAARKADRKPATVNQDLEEMFKPVHEPEKMAEYRPCTHFLKDCEDCQDYKDAMKIAEASEKAEPFNLDLEMDSISDPEPFSNIDYVDSDWGKVEREISETVLNRREYLDKIDKLLDLMLPICRANPLLRIDVSNLAKSIMESGFDVEVREAGA